MFFEEIYYFFVVVRLFFGVGYYGVCGDNDVSIFWEFVFVVGCEDSDVFWVDVGLFEEFLVLLDDWYRICVEDNNFFFDGISSCDIY